MKLRALVFCLGLALVGCAEPQQASAPTQPGGPDPAAMSAAISRYGIMLEEISRLTSERPGSSEAATTEPNEIARGLREEEWAYKIDR